MEIQTTVKIDTNRIVNLKEAIPHYSCVVCFSLLTDGVVPSNCDHICCRDCLSCIPPSEEFGLPLCPCCRTPFNFGAVTEANRYFKNMVDLFEIQCKFAGNGCVYISNWTALQAHENICQFEDNEETVCKVCDQWVQGRNRRLHNCTEAIRQRVQDIYVVLSAKCRKQNNEINSLVSDNKRMMSQIIKLNSRFEFCRKRIKILEESFNSKKKHKKDHAIYSSTDEEYEPEDNSASNGEKDFGSACGKCKKIFPRKQLYKHNKRCLKFETLVARQLNFDEEYEDANRVVEAQNESSENVEVLQPYSSLSIRRTTYDQVMNPPFTQGMPSESVVNLSSDEESAQATTSPNHRGNHLIQNVPNLLRMSEANQIYRSGNSVYLGTNVRVTNRLRIPTSQAPITISSPIDLTQSISVDRQLNN